ncbi:MAG: protein kinase, partial [Sedimentisphaerales bacterium]|nr:protein kinase [Sedimentisphaerales bacterium]
DTGRTEDGRCFVVSKLISGSNLRTKIKQPTRDYREAASLVATIAEALHYAHSREITHRDIKPENILIDDVDQPYVADFGLAIRDEDLGKGSGYAGTPLYWSPEQARGEGHRVDGRSDIFSLGNVFYELLTGKRPFRGSSASEIADNIRSVEARPPRQHDDKIPQELDRICLKALAKLATDRYTTAKDMADDLQYFLASQREPIATLQIPARRIFISYRREDSEAFVIQIAEQLRARYGRDAVFVDTTAIRYGADFRNQILQAIRRCDVLLAVIGQRWAGMGEDGSRRIDDPQDLVRVEIETALAEGTPLIPILVDRMPLPPEENLPISLQPLRRKNACSLDTGSAFQLQMNPLIEQLDKLRIWTEPGPIVPPPPPPQPVRIVPKGLRSFDAEDSDFFLELLPGPCDRDGLPESIRFWKTRIEQTDPDKTFPVGVLYGPSGCGKSSLMKAGLLPRLAANVVPVYIEATANDTEVRLLRGIRKVCPAIQPEQDLVDAITTLRRGTNGLPKGSKVLLVIDQFEQWLHAKQGEEGTELTEALRQCDGAHVQCVVMVRDDFWLAISCFMQLLEIRLLEAENSRLVNLFDTSHAHYVLVRFGQTFGRLPEQSNEFNTDHNSFLDQAISGLATDGKVVCVRLALFAEMIKGKPWSPKTLEEVGGTEGVGVTFLEETFSASTAPPIHRLHQKAARGVLKSLLPTTGTDIKGGMRSYDELLTVSGYSQQPENFQELIQILDNELRLITPTDPAGQEVDDDSKIAFDPTKKYYQLTHDYLVPSLREWLTRKQKETWRGRAELRLQERTDQWHRTKIARFLPDPLEYVTIQAGVPRRKRTPEQKAVMRAATRRYGSIAALVAVVLMLLGWGAWEINGRYQVKAITNTLLKAEMPQVEDTINQLYHYRRWANPVLRQKLHNAENDPSAKLKLSLALLSVDTKQLSYLHQRLLECSVEEFPVIRNSLRAHKAKLIGELWTTLRKTAERPERRFNAGMALSDYARDAKEWTETDADFLISQLLNSNPDYQRDLRSYLAPISTKLLTPLEVKFRDSSARDSIREAAASALADFAADDPVRLAKLAI